VRAAGDLDFTGRRHLDRARLVRLVDELADMGTRALSFTGAGDPLVFPGIDEVLAGIHARGLALGVTSNLAMKLGDGLIEGLVRARWLRWSMNGGSEEVYVATNRPRGGSPQAAFATARANVARIVAARRTCPRPTTFHASFIIFPENEHDVLPAARLARELGLDGISFRPDTPFERQTEPLALSPAVAEALALATRTLTGPGFTVHHEATRRADVEKLGDPDLVCFYSNHTTYVAATGDVYPCCYTRVDARYALGNILAQPFRDFWRSEARRAAYRRLHFDSCPSCPYGPTNQLLGRLYAGRTRARDLHRPAAEPSPFI
jgi:radical SAM protein with 4Fe4S-binding SPASM domain